MKRVGGKRVPQNQWAKWGAIGPGDVSARVSLVGRAIESYS